MKWKANGEVWTGITWSDLLTNITLAAESRRDQAGGHTIAQWKPKLTWTSHSGAHGKKGLQSGSIVKAVTTGFADTLAKGHERRIKNITEVLGLRNWKNEVAINWNGEGSTSAGLGVRDQFGYEPLLTWHPSGKVGRTLLIAWFT